jgi:hypothetical protein
MADRQSLGFLNHLLIRGNVMAKKSTTVEQTEEEKQAEAEFNAKTEPSESKTEIAKKAWLANPGKTAVAIKEILASQGHEISLPTVNNAKPDRVQRAKGANAAPGRPQEAVGLAEMAEFLETVKKDSEANKHSFKDGAKKVLEMLENPLYEKIAQLGEENVKRFLSLVK